MLPFQEKRKKVANFQSHIHTHTHTRSGTGSKKLNVHFGSGRELASITHFFFLFCCCCRWKEQSELMDARCNFYIPIDMSCAWGRKKERNTVNLHTDRTRNWRRRGGGGSINFSAIVKRNGRRTSVHDFESNRLVTKWWELNFRNQAASLGAVEEGGMGVRAACFTIVCGVLSGGWSN